MGREKIQFVDTPGILDRPADERNAIEQQALSAVINVADVILFIIDPSGHCGYPTEVQQNLLEEVQGLVEIPIIVAANKSDITRIDQYASMSTENGEGVDEVLEHLLSYRPAPTKMTRAPPPPPEHTPEQNQ
jgi:nucleolar GTP-binding protein